MTSSSLLSVLPPTLPAFSQNFEMCLVPESQRIVTIVWPGPSLFATSTAAMPIPSQFLYDKLVRLRLQLTALLLPTKSPSFSTSHLAIARACSSFTLTASSIISLPASKLAVTLLIPIPSTMVSTCDRLLVPSFCCISPGQQLCFQGEHGSPETMFRGSRSA